MSSFGNLNNQITNKFNETLTGNYQSTASNGYEVVMTEDAMVDVINSTEYSHLFSNILGSIDSFLVQHEHGSSTVKFQNEMLSKRQSEELFAQMPYYLQHSNPRLMYSIERHGVSMKEYLVLVILDSMQEL